MNLASNSEPVEPPPLPPRAQTRIIVRASLCALIAFITALALFSPWHATSDDSTLEALGCTSMHGHCPGDNGAAPQLVDHDGFSDVGVVPLLGLFGVAGLAGLAALSGTRQMQLASSLSTIAACVLLAPYVVFVSGMAHFMSSSVSRGGEKAFYIMLLATFATGIVNLIDPRRGLPETPETRLPPARARIHVSGMHVPRHSDGTVGSHAEG